MLKWPSIRTLEKKLKLPKEIVLDQLQEMEISELISRLKIWYPTIKVGSESRHLLPQFYNQKAFLNGGNAYADIYPIVFKHKEELIGIYTVEINRFAKIISGPLGVIAPEFRSSGISNVFAPIIIELGTMLKIGLIWGFATLHHPYIQLSFEKSGFMPVGIVPAFDEDLIEEGKMMRVAEVVYAKVLCDPHDILIPSKQNLTPDVLKLWTFLFPNMDLKTEP